jgi:hypothetical protein
MGHYRHVFAYSRTSRYPDANGGRGSALNSGSVDLADTGLSIFDVQILHLGE